ncbi:hypothetical protein ECB98_24720 [Brucellaceae bacterium VT-16-1752]|nr:hypothetical protein ECB98_24720 [Brucellaceae bacterium VT-16-1752]
MSDEIELSAFADCDLFALNIASKRLVLTFDRLQKEQYAGDLYAIRAFAGKPTCWFRRYDRGRRPMIGTGAPRAAA